MLPNPSVEGDRITPDMFGGNFLADRYDLDDDLADAIDNLNVSGLRYPGGSLTERLFDIRNPDATTATEDDGSIVDFVPLSDFLDFAAAHDQTVTIVLPTRDALSQHTDANGDRFAEVDEAALRDFVRDLATGEYGDAEIKAVEIGNEYWGSGQMSAVEYGRLSSEMARIIDDEFDLVAQETGEDVDIDIVVQAGFNWGYSNLRDDFEGLTFDETLDALNDRYGTDFGREMILDTGGLNWQLINDTLIRQEFSDDELDAVDGVAAHLYSKNPVQPGQRDFSLDQIEQAWVGENPDIDIYVTEWNQSAADPRFDDDTDFGLRSAHELLNTFETLVESGVDYAHVWPLLQNTRNALQPDSMDGDLSPSGALFSMMSDALPGKQMLDFAIDDDAVTEFQGRTADLHGFYGEDELVFYIASTSDQTETVTFDLDTMIESGGTVTGTLLGVPDGSAPGATTSRATTEDLEEADFYDDGLVVATLAPGEILEVRITNFEPTDSFGALMDHIDNAGPDGLAIADLSDADIDALFLEPEVDAFDDEALPDPAEEEGEDGGIGDVLSLLLAMLPILALGGFAG